MGELIIFRQRERKPMRRQDPPAGGSAEILFFTGVRYERDVEFDADESEALGGTFSPDGLPPSASPRKRGAR